MSEDMVTGQELEYRKLMADVFRGLEADDVALGARDRVRIEHGDGSKYTLSREEAQQITDDAIDAALDGVHDGEDDAQYAADVVEGLHDVPERFPPTDELEDRRDPIEDIRPALVSDGFSHAEYVDTSEYDTWQEDGLDAFLDHPDAGFEQWYEDTVRNLDRIGYDRPEQLVVDIANLPYTGTGHPPSESDEPYHEAPERGLLKKVRSRIP